MPNTNVRIRASSLKDQPDDDEKERLLFTEKTSCKEQPSTVLTENRNSQSALKREIQRRLVVKEGKRISRKKVKKEEVESSNGLFLFFFLFERPSRKSGLNLKTRAVKKMLVLCVEETETPSSLLSRRESRFFVPKVSFKVKNLGNLRFFIEISILNT
jgi:hypothetical protein